MKGIRTDIDLFEIIPVEESSSALDEQTPEEVKRRLFADLFELRQKMIFIDHLIFSLSPWQGLPQQ